MPSSAVPRFLNTACTAPPLADLTVIVGVMSEPDVMAEMSPVHSWKTYPASGTAVNVSAVPSLTERDALVASASPATRILPPVSAVAVKS